MVASEVRTVGVLVGGSSTVRDESLQSGQHVVQSLQSQGLVAHIIDVTDPNLVARLRSVDVVFVSLLGEMGESGATQGFLEFLQIPHTGSGVLGSALCANKLLAKQVYEFHGIPTPKYRTIYLRESLPEQLKNLKKRLSFPTVVKPISGSLGKGVTFVLRYSDLEPTLTSLASGFSIVLVEECVSSNTFVAHVIDIDGEPTPLPIIEIDTANQLYDSARRANPESYTVVVPARLPSTLQREAQQLAVSAHIALGCTGISCTDVFADPFGKVFVTETDSIFSLSKQGMLFRAALSAGISYDTMVSAILSAHIAQN